MTLDDYSIHAIRAHLSKRGYDVTLRKSYAWETPKAFALRHGYGPTWFCTVRKRKPYPLFEVERGRTGRVVRMRSNAELEAWARR